MKYFAIILSAIALCCCKTNSSHNCIYPLPQSDSADSLQNSTIYVGFNTTDFNWSDSTLKVTIYQENRYHTADVEALQIGDTLLYEGKKMPINTIETIKDIIQINGDLEHGGVNLTSCNDGTYRATSFDDHSVFTKIGNTTFPIGNTLRLIDCGENPQDASTTITSGIQGYLDSIPNYRKNFAPINTTISIAGGVVTEIHRIWIP